MYRSRMVLLSLGILIITGSRSQAAVVALNETSFENPGAFNTDDPPVLDPNDKTDVNYRNWGSGNNILTAGAGGGVNEGFWLTRGYVADNLDQGDLRQDAVTGKTGNQFHAHGAGGRGIFQYVGGTFADDFELKVDVYAPTAVTATYELAVVGFDAPNEVKVDVGGPVTMTLASMISNTGAGGFEVFGSGAASPGTSGVFNEITLSGTFTDTYDYIGVMLIVRGGGGATSTTDYVGFDNVRLTVGETVIPEPSSFIIMALSVLGLAVLRLRRRG